MDKCSYAQAIEINGLWSGGEGGWGKFIKKRLNIQIFKNIDEDTT